MQKKVGFMPKVKKLCSKSQCKSALNAFEGDMLSWSSGARPADFVNDFQKKLLEVRA